MFRIIIILNDNKNVVYCITIKVNALFILRLKLHRLDTIILRCAYYTRSLVETRLFVERAAGYDFLGHAVNVRLKFTFFVDITKKK